MTTSVEKEIIKEAAEVIVPTEVVAEEIVETTSTAKVTVARGGGRGAVRGRSPRGGGRSRAPRERGGV